MPVAHPLIVTDFVDHHHIEELGETIDVFMVVRQQELGQTIVVSVGKEQELWFMSSLDDVLCSLACCWSRSQCVCLDHYAKLKTLRAP